MEKTFKNTCSNNKKQLLIENRFHKAMQKMRTTSNQSRRSYLHWIMHQMFSLFDYESGLHAINDKPLIIHGYLPITKPSPDMISSFWPCLLVTYIVHIMVTNLITR